MSRSDEETEALQVWRTLSEAGLLEIALDEFAEKIREVKHIVVVRLSELLDLDAGTEERESAASSLGTLKGLELKVLENNPNSSDPSKL
jgi:hypothetical protein